ncbi:molybdopterin-dependent oxidoreductase [Cognatishimia sp. F0-27]|uniref:molybdopterin-dependent oxidoreductase n=1 Tax=Cognatishimia sp. F0-27 TaxID=2816855 RepID=UPI001D0C71C6|nr:molybdopterin-dependent oxidoreductase [Cognatishimia sp. F0-27]MCC1493854.1 molybdopterin-dependent oxidoreductase [Cognatishimia sp. F0-27]
MMNRLATTVMGLAFAMLGAITAQAEEIAAPTGAPILTVTGDIDTTNVDDTLVLDVDRFAALGTVTVETSTIWTDGVNSFEGVPLATLVDLVGADSGRLLASAINDYTVEIPVSDAVEGGPILAYRFNGEEMSVRDKGPLWIIYPYDQSADYRTEVTYSRSIWQLDRIEVVR